ncbi:MAG TPA: isoaspartyl peptidase/L-asparaginase, partial [bacterium]|nr:isoaspartyl peptidase/L-asparaginase [bacterium]
MQTFAQEAKLRYAIAIHGGAGTILKSSMTPEKEAAYKNALTQAINTGEQVLKQGGSALDAVEAAAVLGHRQPCSLHLARAGLAAQLLDELVQLADAGGADR